MKVSTKVSVLLLATLGFAGLAWSGDGFLLVTPDEYSREQAARVEQAADGRTKGEIFDQQVWTRAIESPAIEVVTPDAKSPVHSPVDILVKFEPAPGATIALDSLRIKYGVLGLDVTDRIRQAATVTQQGIQVKGAELPSGSHSMSIEIADSAGRKTKQSFRFRVAG